MRQGQKGSLSVSRFEIRCARGGTRARDVRPTRAELHRARGGVAYHTRHARGVEEHGTVDDQR
jgi:hypothetical protein